MQCVGTCQYLNERRHKCEKTGEKLCHSKITICGSVTFTIHEHRGRCEQDDIYEQEMQRKERSRYDN
jgi:hypothetical protein